ncbi:MAG: hypothetical protein ACI9DG_000748 [Oleispira sp.]|jgi:hypothetical protein
MINQASYHAGFFVLKIRVIYEPRNQPLNSRAKEDILFQIFLEVHLYYSLYRWHWDVLEKLN